MNSDLSKIIGKRINTLLAELDKKQKELAAFLGVPDNTISYFVSGRRTPNTEQLAKIADFFNVSADYLLGRTNAKTTDKDVQFVCEYSGLSEKSITLLHEYETKVLPPAMNFLLENWRTSWDLIRIHRCFLDYRSSWQEMNYFIDEMNDYLPDRKTRRDNSQEAINIALFDSDLLNEQTINKMNELYNSYSNSKLKRDVQKLRLQEYIYNILNEYCRDYLENEQENETDFEDFATLLTSLEIELLCTQQKDGEPHGNDQ